MQDYLGTDCFVSLYALYLSSVSLFLIYTYKCLFCFSYVITIDGNMNSEHSVSGLYKAKGFQG